MRQRKRPAVYILANARNGTLYVGVTTSLHQRMDQHVRGHFGGFTERYGVKLLVYYEMQDTIEAAVRRETRLKKWNRVWKLRLIEQLNPEWNNLYVPDTGEILFGSGDSHAFEEPDTLS